MRFTEFISEDANPKRQAAIAIAMKKAGKKPKNEDFAMEDEQIDGMAQGEIRAIIKNAIHIKDQLERGVSLDGWMYSYVTTSNDHLNSVAEQINNPNIDEGELDKYKKYTRPVVKTTPKIERATNPSGRSTDHVEWIVTSDTGEKKRFTSKKSAQEYYDMCTKQGVAEAGMPSSVVKSKQRYAAMSDKDFHTAHKDKSEDDLKAMAWRHGYGKGSTHYVDKHKKGQQDVAEGWSQKYKKSINCSHPKGFSQKAHCAGKKKHNESIDNVMEMTCPDCGMCETHVDHTNLDEACWDTHKQVGMKNKGGKQVPNCVPKESTESTDQVVENLHKWFKEKWVRFGPDGKIRGDCARGSESEGKPKCLPQSKAHSLGKKGRASAASRKRREDPNANRSGKAINVSTKGKGK